MSYGEDDFHWMWGLTTVRVTCNHCGMITGATIGSYYSREQVLYNMIETFPHFDRCALAKAANKAAESKQ